MKTGNKRQAIILSVVAVGAIGFLVLQLAPGKINTVLAMAGGREANTSPAPVTLPTDLPLTIIGNPFSHPKLAVKAVVTVSNPAPALIGIDKSGGLVDPSGSLPSASKDSNEPGGTEENAGKSRQKDQGPSIKVTAILSMGDPIASLEVDQKDAKTFVVGDLVAKGARLIGIDQSSVTVRISNEDHVIHVGETYGEHKENGQ